MSIKGEQDYNFTKANNANKKSILVPLSTLQEIADKMQLCQSDLLELMEANNDTKINRADKLVGVVGRVSFVIGAVKFYLGDEK